jgi:hypothetical protein
MRSLRKFSLLGGTVFINITILTRLGLGSAYAQHYPWLRLRDVLPQQVCNDLCFNLNHNE